MTRSPQRRAAAGYQIRVAGHLDQRWSAWFGGLDLTREDDGTTSLTGLVSDQAELHGLLAKVRDLGVVLISVAVIDPPTGADPLPDVADAHAAGTPQARDTTSPSAPTGSGYAQPEPPRHRSGSTSRSSSA
ncbi:hypothetical protein [Cellulomonas sp. WB94]|uniref:hypothetical protein n=1 Tax=Cellulomonas sp. WB94 TaxID=2173174 RepID=UPI00267CCD3C